MAKYLLIFLASSFSYLYSLAQAPAIQWQKTLGGTDFDSNALIQQTPDGGYIIAGYSRSNDGDVSGNHGIGDIWIVKLNSNRTLQWQKTLGGTGDDGPSRIQQTSDGGYIVAGSTNSTNGDITGNHGETDFWIVKLMFTLYKIPY